MPRFMTSLGSRTCTREGNPSFSSQKSVRVRSPEYPDLFLTAVKAGQDATDAFFSLHRYEVLNKPQYQRLIVGKIEGEDSTIHDRVVGEISTVPYGEPTWLSPGYHSPYYSEVST